MSPEVALVLLTAPTAGVLAVAAWVHRRDVAAIFERRRGCSR